jgi:hypothetical protein
MLNAFFGARLLLYLWVAIIDKERGTLIQNLEIIVICEESSTNANGNMVILDVYPMMKGENKGRQTPNQCPQTKGEGVPIFQEI